MVNINSLHIFYKKESKLCILFSVIVPNMTSSTSSIKYDVRLDKKKREKLFRGIKFHFEVSITI